MAKIVGKENIISKRIPLPDNFPSDVDQLIACAFLQSIDSFSSQDIHNAYVHYSEAIGVRILNGVVATPDYVADYMVKQSGRESNKEISNLVWYDPCVGSGVFVEAILKSAINVDRDYEFKDLPRITIADISPAAIYTTILVVRLVLESNGISSRDYIDSERFNVRLYDSLEAVQEHKSLLDEEISCDVVIGNPPYVRGSRLSFEYKKKLKKLYPSSYNGNADLYYYFIANGLSCLRDKGVLCFISPASFMKAKSAYGLRGYISSNTVWARFLDLDETNIFEHVDLHSVVYWLRKGRSKDGKVPYSHLTKDKELHLLKNDSVQYREVELFSNGCSGIAFKINKTDIKTGDETIFLSQAGVAVYSGVRPGHRKAFVRDKSEFDSLPSNIKLEWVKPSMSAKEINKWQTTFSDNRIIYIENNDKNVPSEILELLSPFKKILSGRYESKCKDDWYKLRSCSYSDVFKKNRIVFPDISSTSRFSLVTEYGINLDGSFIIDTDNLAVLGVLNSAPMWEYLKTTCGSIGNANSKGRLRMKKNYIERIPFPREIFEGSIRVGAIESLVLDMLENGESTTAYSRLTELVASLYE